VSSVTGNLCICCCSFSSSDVIRRSLKPFYPAIDKLHRPTKSVRNFAVCCHYTQIIKALLPAIDKLHRPTKSVRNFAVCCHYTQDNLFSSLLSSLGFLLHTSNRLQMQVCVIMSSCVSSVCWFSLTLPCKHRHTSLSNRLRRHQFVASQVQYHNLLQSNYVQLTAS
jgi:hypothetical protein